MLSDQYLLIFGNVAQHHVEVLMTYYARKGIELKLQPINEPIIADAIRVVDTNGRVDRVTAQRYIRDILGYNASQIAAAVIRAECMKANDTDRDSILHLDPRVIPCDHTSIRHGCPNYLIWNLLVAPLAQPDDIRRKVAVSQHGVFYDVNDLKPS